MMRALRIYAGPAALAHVCREGLQPAAVGIVPGAAGGPKGLILGPLDRFLFGHWLPHGGHSVHLVSREGRSCTLLGYAGAYLIPGAPRAGWCFIRTFSAM